MKNSVLKQQAKNILKKNFWELLLLMIPLFAVNYYYSETPFLVSIWLLAVIGMTYVTDKTLYYISEIDSRINCKNIIEMMSFSNFLEYFKSQIMMFIFIFLWMLLFIIPGIIKSFSYSLVPYLVANKGYDWRTAFQVSKEKMNGKKFDLFLLGLSFILWYLTIPLTLGLSVFWVVPYMLLTEYQFYQAVMKENIIEVEPKPNF